MSDSFSMRHLLRWCIAVLMVLTIVVYYHESSPGYDFKVYELENGYAYRIYKGNKVLIQQDFIPAIEGYKPFKKETHAREAARLVIAKLKKNGIPALSIQEIKAIVDD